MSCLTLRKDMCAVIVTAACLHSSWGQTPPSSEPHYYRPTHTKHAEHLSCDVAVYGGTPAGVTAAIQAAREGKKTILMSFGSHVGGLSSGGLTTKSMCRASATRCSTPS